MGSFFVEYEPMERKIKAMKTFNYCGYLHPGLCRSFCKVFFTSFLKKRLLTMVFRCSESGR